VLQDKPMLAWYRDCKQSRGTWQKFVLGFLVFNPFLACPFQNLVPENQLSEMGALCPRRPLCHQAWIRQWLVKLYKLECHQKR
jgi:hypothetical protein